MQFPSRDLTEQYISSSYQDVLQQYYPSGNLFYVLDGLGAVVTVLNSSSVGDLIVTSNMTSSMSVATASFALTYSVVNIVTTSFFSTSASFADTASYVLGSGTSTTASFAYSASVSIASIFADTSSVSIASIFADTSSLAGESISASYTYSASYAQHSLTASYIMNEGGMRVSSSFATTSSYTLNGGLNIPNYDYSYIAYDGPMGQISNCTYKVGGISGSIVCIITALYSGSIFIGSSKSLG